MITLRKLKWDNCFSYGSGNELQLDSNTVTQILGTNGMGKSSIPLIIEEALFNKNSKGIKKADIPNRNINNGYYICLSFTKDADEYEVEITRKSNIKVKLLHNGDDISSHTATNTYKSIGDLLGVDFKTFSQLVYQNTNSSLQFLTATDTNRKKFLIDLLHLENYVELFEVFKNAAKLATTENTRALSQIETIEKWLSDNKLTDATILPLLKLEINTEEEEKELRFLTKEIENISEKNKKINKNNKYKELLDAINLDEIRKIDVSKLESYDSLQSEMGQKEAVVAGSQRLLTKLEKLGDDCPTCEQSIDSSFKQSLIDQEREKLENASLAIGKLKNGIEEIQRRNQEFRKRESAERDWQELYRSLDHDLPTALLDKEDLEQRMGRVRAELLRAKKSLEETARDNEKRTRQNTRIQVIQEQTDEFLRQLAEGKKILESTSEVVSNLEVLKKAFSTNGLLAYKIENLVEELEELVNQYLAELSDGRFTLEFVVTNDKLNVQITDNENIVDILALSSGELARVNTATLLAIRKLMSSISKSRLNILFLDEVINVLDAAGREKLVEVLLEEDLNTYIVSHQWEHPLLDKLEIVRKEGVSCVE
jgi:DNA repair exonuclease SbcCD ATPase subunit